MCAWHASIYVMALLDSTHLSGPSSKVPIPLKSILDWFGILWRRHKTAWEGMMDLLINSIDTLPIRFTFSTRHCQPFVCHGQSLHVMTRHPRAMVSLLRIMAHHSRSMINLMHVVVSLLHVMAHHPCATVKLHVSSLPTDSYITKSHLATIDNPTSILLSPS